VLPVLEIAAPLLKFLLKLSTLFGRHAGECIHDLGHFDLYLGALRKLGGFVDDHVAVSNVSLERLHTDNPSPSRANLHARIAALRDERRHLNE